MQALHEFSTEAAWPSLTERQVQILELIAKRFTLKQVAAELGISESAVNQHVRSLKGVFRVNSLPELAECHRLMTGIAGDPDCRKTAYRKPLVANAAGFEQRMSPDDNGSVVTFHDPLTYRLGTPWEDQEPVVVPKLLDGSNAKLVRAAYIVAIAIGFFVLILVGLGVAQGLSDVLADKAASSST